MKTSARGTRTPAPDSAHPVDGGRRGFLRALALGTVALAAAPRPAFAFANLPGAAKGQAKGFAFAQLRYAGGAWDPYPTAAGEFNREIERMTSVEVEPARRELSVADPLLFASPFLFVAGTRDFAPFTPTEVERLRTWVEAGGTLVGDDAAGTPGHGFDAAFRRELERILPTARLERLPADHTVFKSFFLVRTVAGARVVSPFLEGLTLQGRTAVIYSPNNLLGAFARDPLGRWVDPCAPGGERQRRQAFHLGVNIVMYALCGDYKQDRIHLPFLRQRV